MRKIVAILGDREERPPRKQSLAFSYHHGERNEMFLLFGPWLLGFARDCPVAFVCLRMGAVWSTNVSTLAVQLYDMEQCGLD
jgi:predicted LPLAT superfamily acyltransferase